MATSNRKVQLSVSQLIQIKSALNRQRTFLLSLIDDDDDFDFVECIRNDVDNVESIQRIFDIVFDRGLSYSINFKVLDEEE